MPIIVDPAPLVPAADPGTLSSAGDRFYARLEPIAYADPDNGFALKNLVAALMAPRQAVDDLVRDTVDVDGSPVIGWAPAVDPDLIPAEGQLLEWLAQLPGLTFEPSVQAAEEKRAVILAAAGFWRGTPRAIRDAVQRTLTGTKYVGVIERPGGDPYQLVVVTRTSETPDTAVTARAALSQKPAGMVLSAVTTSEPIVDEGSRSIDAATVTIDAPPALADVT